MWATKTPVQAFELLSRPDVNVTNQSDKELQLRKLQQLHGSIKRAATLQRVESPTTGAGGAAAEAPPVEAAWPVVFTPPSCYPGLQWA